MTTRIYSHNGIKFESDLNGLVIDRISSYQKVPKIDTIFVSQPQKISTDERIVLCVTIELTRLRVVH